MKGFPPRLRTRANLLVLSHADVIPNTSRKGGQCLHRWEAIPKEDLALDEKNKGRALRLAEAARRCRKCGTLEWWQLEKIRTLARLGFSRSPNMRIVTKSFKTEYGKRRLLPGGGSEAIVLDERAMAMTPSLDAPKGEAF